MAALPPAFQQQLQNLLDWDAAAYPDLVPPEPLCVQAARDVISVLYLRHGISLPDIYADEEASDVHLAWDLVEASFRLENSGVVMYRMKTSGRRGGGWTTEVNWILNSPQHAAEIAFWLQRCGA